MSSLYITKNASRRNSTEENRQPASSDIPADYTPPMENERPVDNGNSNPGVHPVQDEDRSSQEPSVQWDNPGNGNGEPSMMEDDRGNGQMLSDPGNQSPPQDSKNRKEAVGLHPVYSK